MTSRQLIPTFLCAVLCLGAVGCHAPGKPGAEPEVPRPEQVLDFATLYKSNCAACHGANGQNGAAISLANPIYLAFAGAANIERITTTGVPGTQMPAFGKSSGGMLTDQQIAALTNGMISAWGSSSADTKSLPPYASTLKGDAAHGEQAFAAHCAGCHTSGSSQSNLTDPAYLALISDQGLRSFIAAGHAEKAISPPASDQEIADTVAWLAAHRTATPGQPYQQHQ